MSKLTSLLALAVLFLAVGTTRASSVLNGEYSIESSWTPVSGESSTYVFQYTITNNNQQDPGYGLTGLDGFSIAIPAGAIISDVSWPLPAHGDSGHWAYNMPTSTLNWWGYEEASVYPINSKATFRFKAKNVAVTNQAKALVTTYWAYHNPQTGNEEHLNPGVGTWYSQYDATVAGPTAVPLPAAAWTGLLLLGGLGVARMMRKRLA